jgi:hypothetical protein
MHTIKDSMWREIWKILQNILGTKQGPRQGLRHQHGPGLVDCVCVPPCVVAFFSQKCVSMYILLRGESNMAPAHRGTTRLYFDNCLIILLNEWWPWFPSHRSRSLVIELVNTLIFILRESISIVWIYIDCDGYFTALQFVIKTATRISPKNILPGILGTR